MDSIIAAIDFVIAVLLAAALAMVAFAHRELRAARLMLLIAATYTIARWLMWSFSTDQPWIVRGIVGAIVGALILGGLPALYKWAKERGEPIKKEQLPTLSASVPSLPDYAYGLQLQRIDLDERRELDKESKEAKIVKNRDGRLALRFRNGMNQPIGYIIKRFVLDGTEQTNFLTRGGVIAANGETTFYSERRKLDPAKIGEMFTAKLDLEFTYGNPDHHSRLATKIINLEFYSASGTTYMLLEKDTDQLLQP